MKLKRERERNSTELQNPNIEAEVYNNKKCDWGKKKSLIGFHRANKIDNYNRGEGKNGEKKKKNPKESVEQVKT